MNQHTPTPSELEAAYDILAEVADDALNLAEAANCFTPSYLKQCGQTALEFHPCAKSVTVLDSGDLVFDDGNVKMRFELETLYDFSTKLPDFDWAEGTFPQLSNVRPVETFDDAVDLVVDIGIEAVRLATAAGQLTPQDLPRFISQVVAGHPYADRMKVVDYGDLVYEHEGVFVHYEFDQLWDSIHEDDF